MKKAGFGLPAQAGIRDSAVGLFAAILVMVTLSGCTSRPTPTTEEFFPRSGEVAGWAKSGETRTFGADRLWEYIDGDADRYVQAGVERTLTADYRYQGKVEAVADIYVMKAPQGARKIFDAESSAGSQPVNVGDEARLFPASLVFRKARHLVRVTGFDEVPGLKQALVELGRALAKKL